MNRKALLVLAAVVACTPCVEWTRFKGEVKTVNLKDSTLTIQNKDGDLITIPIDYQVKIIDKKNILRDLKSTAADQLLGSTVTLIRVISNKSSDDSEGLVPAKFPGQ